ncbi:homeobox protein BEL1 homolog [Arachis duranensis]|uniref:Homeobox protein BEL1 homolog n=1 Tax=Arachis duranensis TaxID=130453 RepID=A0A6P4CS63_ARADU|nr:homeobox protein BEL1 homolog [Arachis duranensis]
MVSSSSGGFCYTYSDNPGGGGGSGFVSDPEMEMKWKTLFANNEPPPPTCFDLILQNTPSQGLSLSLSSNNPSSISLQSFPLRQQHHEMALQGHYSLKASRFLLPAQQLLNEFCSLGTKQLNNQLIKRNKNNTNSPPLTSLDLVELHKRKAKLLVMLQEVDTRYEHYCNQMKGVVASFEAMAGEGAATVYSALALKAMSRHFRCLKDGILEQIEATRKGMGEKDPIAPGTTKGQTPRLRIIDQALRQQRAFHQTISMESHPWRPQRGLPERSVSLLRAWLFEHFLHPYPSDVDKHILARQTGLSRSQVSNWFINARVRLWKPMVEEMYLEEEKEAAAASSEGGGGSNTEDFQNLSPNSAAARPEDQKPRLLRIDSECMSSIINNNSDHRKDNHEQMNQQEEEQYLGRGVADTFGSVEIDFSSYPEGFNSSGGGAVSLTLGLQQHGGNGVSLAFPPETHHQHQASMFYSSRDQIIEDCSQPVQYSLLDGEAHAMPYRNLMGTQLLHDLAG